MENPPETIYLLLLKIIYNNINFCLRFRQVLDENCINSIGEGICGQHSLWRIEVTFLFDIESCFTIFVSVVKMGSEVMGNRQRELLMSHCCYHYVFNSKLLDVITIREILAKTSFTKTGIEGYDYRINSQVLGARTVVDTVMPAS